MKIMLCQVSNNVINPRQSRRSPAEFMYDCQWVYKESYGYWKPEHFWELPLWIGEVTYALGDRSRQKRWTLETELHIMEKSHWLPHADAYCFSVLEVNKAWIKETIKAHPNCRFYLGGYVDPAYFADCKQANVTWCDTVQDLCHYFDVEYKYGVDWSLFAGTRCIPRLTMSYGCSHHCTFCTVPNSIQEVPWYDVYQQLDAMKSLKFKLVYLNDKTWGMAKNHRDLIHVYYHIKAFNPEFEGFIVQTSVNTMRSFGTCGDELLEFMRKAHVKVIELGIETFNDHLLARYRKPQREKSISHVVKMLSEKGFHVVANIMLGLPGETIFSYYRTLGWLAMNYEYLFGTNIYTLALYENSALAKEIESKSLDDGNELSEDRTFWTQDEQYAYAHMARRFYELGAEIWTQRRGNVPRVERGK